MKYDGLRFGDGMVVVPFKATLNGTGTKQALRAYASVLSLNPKSIVGVPVEPGQAAGSGFVPRLDQLQRAVLLVWSDAAVAGSFEVAMRRGAKAATQAVPAGLADVRFGDDTYTFAMEAVDNWAAPDFLASSAGSPAISDGLQIQVSFTPDDTTATVVQGLLILAPADVASGTGRGNALSGAQYR